MSFGPFQATVAVLRRFRRLTRGIARHSPSIHPKHAQPGLSKGYGNKGLGRFTRKGQYVLDWYNRVPEFMVPDLTDCQLQPYVSSRTPKVVVPPPPGSYHRPWFEYKSVRYMPVVDDCLTRSNINIIRALATL